MTVTYRKKGQAGLPTSNPSNSFWLSELSEILLGHRTTVQLPSKADVIIIGSGIAGTSAARWLREHGEGKDLNVVMLEAREACSGATGRNGGHCQPVYFNSQPQCGAFELRNYEDLKFFVKKNNVQCDWRSTNTCHVYMKEDEFEEAVKDAKKVKSLDPNLGKLITIIDKDSVNPSLSDLRMPKAVGIIKTENAASLWPYKLISWILEDLISKNKTSSPLKFNLQTSTPVTRLQKTTSEWIVHTSRGQISAPKVLLTTNAYTSHLLPAFTDLIVPVRGQMASLIPPSSMSPSEDSSNKPLEYSYSLFGAGGQTVEQDDYLIQRPYLATSNSQNESGGEIMFGGGRRFAFRKGVGIYDDSSIDKPTARYLREELPRVVDLHYDGDKLKASFEWTGIMGYSRDSLPWVGNVSDELGGGEGLYICAGFTGNGMSTARLSAKAVVGFMMGENAVDLPDKYILDAGRVKRAREMDEVSMMDEDENL
ncbi:hypothetical protein EYC84_000810 [Monilinia fructicola]|uniref:FAD dependent oxidoreductase domain-containing protein n=1 Tax=Monilinia fructicola TaxID=38448 RepID=A0A5M9JKF0_MONFR|nr:hypothetical protein EYC84_000810 [Monilinia fructicola]